MGLQQKQTQVHMSTYNGRVPPQAVEVEENVLGGMMLDRTACDEAIVILKPDDFYKPANRHVYEAIVELYNRNDSVDLITIENYLKDKSLLDHVGAGYLADLTRSVSSASNIEYHAQIIKEKSIKRRLILYCNEIQKDAYDQTTDAMDVLDKAEERIFSLYQNDTGTTYSIGESLHSVIDTINRIQEDGERQGIQTGLDIDDVTMGFEKGKYYVIAARPSMGKTALALTIMRKIAGQGKKSSILSLETSHTSLAFRLLTSVSKISVERLKSPGLTKHEIQTILDSAGKLSQYGIYLDDTISLSDQQLRAKSRNLIRKYGIDILFVDFLQLMSADGDRKDLEIGNISRSFKITAKELNIPVVALSQLNRAVESRNDKRPVLSDLRESGSIEQDADVVMFLYRPEYYDIKEYPNGDSTENMCDIIVAKNKDGRIGTKRQVFLKDQMRFENPEYRHSVAPF